MADIKTTLKNIESLVIKQNENIAQLAHEMKALKPQGLSGQPPPPPPPPPSALKLPSSEKDKKYDMLLNELKSALRLNTVEYFKCVSNIIILSMEYHVSFSAKAANLQK